MNFKTLFTLLTRSLPQGLTSIQPIHADRWTCSIPGLQVGRHTVGLDSRGVWLRWQFIDGAHLQIWWTGDHRTLIERNHQPTTEQATIGLQWSILPLKATLVVTIRSASTTETLRGRL